MNPKIDTAAEREEAEAAAFVDAEYAAADKYLADEWSHYAITDETRAIVRSAWAERAKQSAPFASAAPAAVAPAHIDADKLQRWEAALECGALWASGSEGYSRISRALQEVRDARHAAAELVGRKGVEQCPRGDQRPEPTCTNRHQCWEPCGELGNDERYVRVSRTDPEEVKGAISRKSAWHACSNCKGTGRNPTQLIYVCTVCGGAGKSADTSKAEGCNS